MDQNEKNGSAGYPGLDELRDAERRYRTVIEQSPLSVHVFAPDGRSLLANSSWNELWNLQEGEEPEGTSIFEDAQIRATGLLPYIEQAMGESPVTPPPLLYDPARTGRGGEQRWLQAFVYPVRDDGGSVREVTLIIEDVTERKALEDRLAYQAFHDPLTGLPNRALLLDRLEQALKRVERRSDAGNVALLFTDLDNFKYVNDSLGHKAGDNLLVKVAGRIASCLRPEDTVARLGGDEFVVLLEGVTDVAEATAVAERIARELEAPFALNGQEVFVTTSTGIVLGGPGKAEDLLRDADVAMYRSKGAGKDRHEVYEVSMRAQASERLGLEGDLRRAVERGAEEFVLRYQPEVDVETGRTVGVEALVRWRHPKRGLMSPAEFVPLAEDTGLIVLIGRRVLEEACRQARGLRGRSNGGSEGRRPIMYVNLSTRQFWEPGLVEDISQILATTGVEPGELALEITESAVMNDAAAAVVALSSLKGLGVELAIDDFGTGYSSMSYLKRFPVDHLKIDRSFVSGLGAGAGEDEVIAAGMVSLAHALGLRVIAEGVETEGQLARLREMGCEVAQGYYFSEPLDAEALEAWLAAGAVH